MKYVIRRQESVLPADSTLKTKIMAMMKSLIKHKKYCKSDLFHKLVGVDSNEKVLDFSLFSKISATSAAL